MRRITRGDVALALSSIAVLTAVGAPAEAARTINGKLLKNKSVAGSKLKNRAITSSKLRSSAVTGSKIRNGTITAADLAPGVLPPTTPTFPDGSVTTAKLADGAVTNAKLGPDSVKGGQFASAGSFDVNMAPIAAFSCASFQITRAGGADISNAAIVATPSSTFSGQSIYSVEAETPSFFSVKVCNPTNAITDPDGAGTTWRYVAIVG